ncbi:Retrotransposon protein, Ty3-gypsy subclass [Phytophthora megakarya]|uniref:Retrotransposon protein, Ty3-gypsy subclass n=1 Tax=Phytophthora megakarya TaxID=4795 RepID=A0A225UX19_9STRA|nr:Retrotransposon protein, Ty3-gypsy subclass [Phytophthora megakarya]
MLSQSATLAFPDDSAVTCLLSDASDYGWAAIVAQARELIKRPLGETIDCRERNGVLHFDFLYLGEVAPVWVSDKESHFKNEVISELRRRLKTQQTFTPVYCPL